MNSSAYTNLRSELEELAYLNSTLGLLQWDQEVHMPEKGGPNRAKLISYLSLLAHEKILGLDAKKGLSTLMKWAKNHPEQAESVVIRETWRTYTRERTLPKAFVQELAERTSQAQSIWAEARAASDFSHFLPSLKRIVELKRQEADYV